MKAILGNLFLIVGMIGVGGTAGCSKEPAAERPNIVIILADDLGYSDVGCYGGVKVETPNIDRLAREGMRFTDAQTPSPICSPSRYGLMTGAYPFRKPAFNDKVLWPFEPLGIGLDQPTLGTLAQSQGYVTGIFGKWHLGLGLTLTDDYNKELKGVPADVGFDESFIDPGNLQQGVYIENRRVFNADPADPFYWKIPKSGKVPNRLMGGEKARVAKKPDCVKLYTDKAVSFVDRHKEEPFLLYFAPNNVHVKIIPGEEFVGKSGCGLYGDYIMELDWMVGEVLAALDRNGLAGNTLVFFTSDNGGGYMRPEVAEAYEMGHIVNGELLGQKHDIWEGGHRVPFIARWPGRVKAGETSDRLVSLLDMMGTMADIWKMPLPAEAGPDSYSFLYAMTGAKPPASRRDALIYQGFKTGMLAVRKGPWVLIPGQGSDGFTLEGYDRPNYSLLSYAELGFTNSDYTPDGKLKPDAPPGQLYNLEDDLSQTANLYRRHPEFVTELTELLERIKTTPQSRP